MNLLEERWIPVRRAKSGSTRIAPHELTDRIDDDPVVALDAPRPDFNGALIQFLIGLVQTAWVRADEFWEREEMLLSPPTPEKLQSMFLPMKAAFELDGEGPRFMQDLTLGSMDSPVENDVAALLIDFPGAQGIERNADHFVKRDTGGALCTHCAAAALFCLMTNAPSGGVGNRTSVRGGGPLTTLVAYSQSRASQLRSALWRDVALNVLDSKFFGQSHSSQQQSEMNTVFPWLRSVVETMGNRGEVQPLDVNPLQIYWAMPRRIRLDFAGVAPGTCAICAQASDALIARYTAKNYGLNYKGPWRHPLSPYYRGKPTEQHLPVHPQPDGLAYRHWLGWALGIRRAGKEVVPATVVHEFRNTRVEPGQVLLRAFGYDMDNMKARCWYETTFPLFDLPVGDSASSEASEKISNIVDALVNAAETVAVSLRLCVRDAWFGSGESRGDLGFVEASFWSRTERDFFDLVQQGIGLARAHGREAFAQSEKLRCAWAKILQRAALRLFDEIAASGTVEAGSPVKLATAHRALRNQLFGDKLRAVLGLIPPDAGDAPRRRKTARTKTTKLKEAR